MNQQSRLRLWHTLSIPFARMSEYRSVSNFSLGLCLGRTGETYHLKEMRAKKRSPVQLVDFWVLCVQRHFCTYTQEHFGRVCKTKCLGDQELVIQFFSLYVQTFGHIASPRWTSYMTKRIYLALKNLLVIQMFPLLCDQEDFYCA